MQQLDLDLSFVTDTRLRELLEDEYRQAQVGLEARCYLGTLVACGAVLEGLLTWALLRDPDQAIARFKQRYPTAPHNAAVAIDTQPINRSVIPTAGSLRRSWSTTPTSSGWSACWTSSISSRPPAR